MLKPTDLAPDFEMECARDDCTEKVSLSKTTAELTVLFFYPRDFSFICPTEVAGFNAKIAEFEAEHTRIIGVSVDDAETHLKWSRELGGIKYPLVADRGAQLAKAYGVLDEETQTALRATYLVDRSRRILYSLASMNNVGRSVNETLRVVRALRSGRLCPADWKPGEPFGPSDQEY